MYNAIPYTGNTANQAVSTVTVQLGATKHHTRPLTNIAGKNSHAFEGLTKGEGVGISKF